MTKILLMNIPGAALPSDYPPVAISRVIEGIDPSLNCDVSFLNLDYYRPDFEEIKAKIKSYKPHIIGFSAVLTPYYAYLKNLSNFIGSEFPDIIQALGGQMAVIANIVLLKTKIAVCVTGESEPAFSNLIQRLQSDNFDPKRIEEYVDVKGLVFLREGMPFYTGYEKEDKQKGLRQFNWKLMSQFTSLDNYIHSVDGQYFRIRLAGSKMDDLLALVYPHNRNKNIATVFASKGCVGRCTFCHRYYKGYSVADFDELVNYIDMLKREYNVGLLLFSEENFGGNKKLTSELVEYLKSTGLNWGATAVRVRNVNEEIIKSWRDAGCIHINFGIESFSQKMLDVMEKNATVEENICAVKLCYKYKIFTIPGIVLGMPGETEETVEETIRNFSVLLPDDMEFPFETYVNFVQAIPGIPLYDYAKRMGFIGESLEDEERYIESLYNVNANEIDHYLNFTDYEKEEVAYWWYYIYLEMISAYIRKFGYFNVLRNKRTKQYRAGLVYICLPKRLRKFLLKYIVLLKYFGLQGLGKLVVKKTNQLYAKKTRKFSSISCSLRKLNSEIPVALRDDEMNVVDLREGLKNNLQ